TPSRSDGCTSWPEASRSDCAAEPAREARFLNKSTCTLGTRNGRVEVGPCRRIAKPCPPFSRQTVKVQADSTVPGLKLNPPRQPSFRGGLSNPPVVIPGRRSRTRNPDVLTLPSCAGTTPHSG